MSKIIISVERVNEVNAHPNADRLDVIQILGYQVVTGKGNFEVGDLAVYFPPDILLKQDVAEELGVAKYLKGAVFPGDEEKTQCRVGAARLRGVPSHGFAAPLSEQSRIKTPLSIGANVTDIYGAKKYEPPVRLGAGDSLPELENFPKYTSIENIQRYPDAFIIGEQVVISEKLHGSNVRMGLVKINGEFQFVAGSHNQRRAETANNKPTFYWQFMDEKVMNLLSYLASETCPDEPCHDVVIYGEIFGPGVQDMDYGQKEKVLRVFDISLDGFYLDHFEMTNLCEQFEIPVVPELYVGPFSHEVVEEHTYGETTFKGVKCKFKDREGCVIKPLRETFSEVLGGRLILKSVSADYRDRKGAQDNE